MIHSFFNGILYLILCYPQRIDQSRKQGKGSLINERLNYEIIAKLCARYNFTIICGQFESIFKMSRCQSHLLSFLKTLNANIAFPRQAINSFLSSNSISNTDLNKTYNEVWHYYLTNACYYKELSMLLFIGLSKNVEQMFERALEFIQGLIISRLIMLIFNDQGQIQIGQVMLFIEPTIQLTVFKGLESGKTQQFLDLLQRVNSKNRKIHELGVILEAGIIKKIEKYLQQSSLHEFKEVLKSILFPQKIKRLNNNSDSLKFKYISLLRQEEDKYQIYYLQFINGGSKLAKIKDTHSTNSLPNWIQEAFWKTPKSLNLSQFRSQYVARVFAFLQQVEIFASSPNIQEFDQYTTQQTFLTIFQKFLLGATISQDPYAFDWKNMKKTLTNLIKISENQSKCYMPSMFQELFYLIELAQMHKTKKTGQR